MKTNITFVLLLIFISLISCNRIQLVNSLSTQSADSIVKKWNDAWNNNNADEVMNLIADDAFLVINKTIITGHDSIRKQFVKNNIGLVKNFQITKVTSKVEKTFTWYCGTFSHVVVQKDKAGITEKGNIIFT